MKKIFHFVPVLALALLAACGGDDNTPSPSPNNGGEGNGNEGGNGTVATQTVENHKKEVMQAATEIQQLLKPEDQKELVDLGMDFADMFGDLDIPLEWEGQWDAPARGDNNRCNIAAFMKFLTHGVLHADVNALTRAAYVYHYNISQVAGIYQPGGNRWRRSGSSTGVIFRWNDSRGMACEAKAMPSGSNMTWNTGDDYEKVSIVIPETLDITLTRGGKSLVKGVVKTKLVSNWPQIDLDLTVMNIQLVASYILGNSNCKANIALKVNGKNVYDCMADATGSNMLDENAWERADDNDRLHTMITAGKANVNVLGRLKLVGNVVSTKNLFYPEGDDWFTSYDGISKEEAIQEVKRYCSRLNNCGDVYLEINGARAANLVAAPTVDEWEGYYGTEWEVYADARAKFPDGSSYSLEDYDIFSSALDVLETIVDTYLNFFDK